MTDHEVKPFVGRAVRVTLADGTILAGTLHRQADTDASSPAYLVESDPVAEGGDTVRARIENADLITQIEDASKDPAAVL
jgi:DNA-directed RNA polymerase subunit E'/Rpb7